MTAMNLQASVLTHQAPTLVPVTCKTTLGMEAFASVKYCVNIFVPQPDEAQPDEVCAFSQT